MPRPTIRACSRLEDGRNRDELADHLIDLVSMSRALIAGLDFAFSLPAWFLQQKGCADVRALWAACHAHGDQWLKTCPTPFWGRPGRRRPKEPPPLFRQTEQQIPATAGTRPKSPFQIGGAGAVGTGSIRGMAVLDCLTKAGFSVWPFDSPRLPMLVEIYPRLLTGAVMKSNQAARRAFLARCYPQIQDGLRTVAVASEDAFDAAISALVMAKHRNELRALPPVTDAVERLEGRIWYPGLRQPALEAGQAAVDGSANKAAVTTRV